MNHGFYKAMLVTGASAGLVIFSGCGVKTSETVKLDEGKLPRTAPVVDDITLVRNAEGLMVQTGKDKPFSGVDIEGLEVPDGDGGVKRFIVETPYSNGLVDGVKKTYFGSGAIREEREYKKGEPVQVKTYYSGGSKKFAGKLNAADRVEGPTQRWGEDGTVLGEGSYDADEKHDGIWKEYDEKGELVGEYLWSHGVIEEVLKETPEQKERRLQHYGEIETGETGEDEA